MAGWKEPNFTCCYPVRTLLAPTLIRANTSLCQHWLLPTLCEQVSSSQPFTVRLYASSQLKARSVSSTDVCCMYRADWEPEAASGKCLAGVPGVFWRCPAVLQGIIQRWFKGKPELRKIGRFSLYACGNGVNLPHVAKHAFGDQMGPNVQKHMAFGSPSHQGPKNCGLSQKNIF